MRFLTFVLILLIMAIFPTASYADSHDQWEKLDQISDQALQMAKQERYEESKQLLDFFSKEFLKLSHHDQNFSMDQLRVITVTHNDAVQAIQTSSVPFDDKVKKVTQFRLVIDAIRSEHQPLWSEMESSIMTTFNQMKQTVVQGDNDSFQQHLNSFINKYELIHPSLKIDIAPITVQKLDSHINFLDSYRNETLKTSTRIQQMEQMELDLQNLFDDMTEDDTDPSLIWVMISTGSIIIVTLSYVGWRKYKGHNQKGQSQRDYEK